MFGGNVTVEEANVFDFWIVECVPKSRFCAYVMVHPQPANRRAAIGDGFNRCHVVFADFAILKNDRHRPTIAKVLQDHGAKLGDQLQ